MQVSTCRNMTAVQMTEAFRATHVRCHMAVLQRQSSSLSGNPEIKPVRMRERKPCPTASSTGYSLRPTLPRLKQPQLLGSCHDSGACRMHPKVRIPCVHCPAIFSHIHKVVFGSEQEELAHLDRTASSSGLLDSYAVRMSG